MPLKSERSSLVKQMMTSVVKAIDVQNKTEKVQSKKVSISGFSEVELDNFPDLVFDNNSINTTIADLRIPYSEIERFQVESKAEKNLQTINIALDNSRVSSKKRENQLHSLIELILAEEPNISAKRAWAVIENDVNSDEPVFDKDGILFNVDADCIEWRSSHGIDQILSWGSFQPLLSQLKKRIP